MCCLLLGQHAWRKMWGARVWHGDASIQSPGSRSSPCHLHSKAATLGCLPCREQSAERLGVTPSCRGLLGSRTVTPGSYSKQCVGSSENQTVEQPCDPEIPFPGPPHKGLKTGPRSARRVSSMAHSCQGVSSHREGWRKPGLQPVQSCGWRPQDRLWGQVARD